MDEKKQDQRVINTAAPKESIYKMAPYQRALGRMVTVNSTLPQQIAEQVGQVEKDLAGDVFWTYYQDLAGRDPLPETRDLNQRLINWAKGSPSWEQGTAKTNGRLLVSAAAAGMLHSQLVSDPEIRKLLDEQKQQEQALKEQQNAEATKKALEDTGTATPDLIKQLEQTAQKAQAKAQASQQKIDQGMDKLETGSYGQAVRASALKQAKKEAEETEAFLSGWGIDPGSVTATDLTAVQRTVEQYGDALEQITRLMGRIKGIALNQQTKKQQKAFVVVEDGYTQKLQNIFPADLSLLNPAAPAVIRASKMGEYCDRGLTGMVEGSQSKKEGGIIFLKDESGSMEGDRNTKATALILGMAQAATENNQPYLGVKFDTQLRGEITNENDWAQHLEWASTFADGGTNFDHPLTRAFEYIETLGEQSTNTDIVMVTDGECQISPAVVARYNDLKDRFGTRIIYLAVGQQEETWGSGEHGIKALATKRLYLGDSMGIDKVAEQLASFLWDEENKR